jgi:GNAT superfamily N-acetyltransferase
MRSIADEEHPPAPGDPPGYPEALDAHYLQLIRHGRTVVAESVDGVVGFGAVALSDRGTHLADLFVRPDLQSRGIGRRLLAAVFDDDAWPRTTFSSSDPRALPLYIRFGMRPLWPNLYLGGDGRRIPEQPAVAVTPAEGGEVAALERAWWGVDRPAMHAYWAGQPQAVPFVVRRDGRPIGAGDARARLRGPGRWVNMFFVAPGEDPLAPTLAAIRFSAGPDGTTGGCLLGPHPAVPALIEAGFRVVDRDTYQASDAGLIDPERLVVNTGFL